MRAIIGTWEMCFEGVRDAYALLENGACAGDAVVSAIVNVEDNPAYTSVGYGALPARDGQIRLDAAYMDGCTLRYGGVISAEGIRNPILAARLLCGRKLNCLLAARGAEEFAISNGLPMRDMRTELCMRRWQEAVQQQGSELPDAYRGHDTVCVIALDDHGDMVVGVSTSGLFMKEVGRVGDSPIIGSGFYCDARYGAAAATGVGEEIMRGCLSHEAVSLMREGKTAREACEHAIASLTARKRELSEEPGNISMIAMDAKGAYGAATTLSDFPYAAGNVNASVQLLHAKF